jgi:glycerate dehydrogenase
MKNMNSIVVLDAQTVGNNTVFKRFSDFGSLTIYGTTTKEERIAHIGNASIIITNKVIIDAFIMDSCPQIQLICLTATGMNNVDLEYASKKGIVVKNVAGYSTESVAQHTFAMFLSLLHSIEYYNSYVKNKEYSHQQLFTHIGPGYWQLQDKTWGIIGLGTIGKRVAQIAQIFGAHIIYYSTSGKNYNSQYTQVSLQELLIKSDVVSIHAPLNEQTLGLIGIDELQHMKSHAYIINVGRGGIVNENDLAEALQKNIIAGACLDVMQQEPIDETSPLLDPKIAHKIIITPHVAWISKEALQTLIECVYNHVKEFVKKEL